MLCYLLVLPLLLFAFLSSSATSWFALVLPLSHPLLLPGFVSFAICCFIVFCYFSACAGLALVSFFADCCCLVCCNVSARAGLAVVSFSVVSCLLVCCYFSARARLAIMWLTFMSSRLHSGAPRPLWAPHPRKWLHRLHSFRPGFLAPANHEQVPSI